MELLFDKDFTRVSSFKDIEPDINTLYYLTDPYDSYEAGLYIFDGTNQQYIKPAAGGGDGNLFVGIVTHTSTLPTTRPDGTALKLGDYVKPDNTETFPFTVGGLTFNSPKDTAVYMGSGIWLVNASAYQNTSETPVKDKTQESISGTSNFQDAINKEVKTTLTYVHTQTTASTLWDIPHNLGRYPSVCCIDSTGKQMIGDVSYPNENDILVEFSTPESGKALLS